jgi:hypothetical protein
MKKKPKTKPPQSTALLCALVSESDEPNVQSRVDTCSGGCQRAVWRALSSPANVRAICRHCVLMELQFSGSEKVAVVPPSKAQRVDILDAKKFLQRYEG